MAYHPGGQNASAAHIPGVNCTVTNCSHHDGLTKCTAQRIHVGPINADSKDETICDTFAQKSHQQ